MDLIGPADENGCWPWLGHIDRDGYGRCGQGQMAHRWVYADRCAPIPDGMTIDHLCRVRHCVNPAHLRVLSAEENRLGRIWVKKDACINGHPYDEANTYVKPNGCRDCRACGLERQRRYQERKRGVA